MAIPAGRRRGVIGWIARIAAAVTFGYLGYLTVEGSRRIVSPGRSPFVPQEEGDPATPAEIGLEYEDVRFTTDDGVTLSGWLGGQCRFHPTCSRYAEEAIRTHGAIRGSILAAGRVLRCNPFGRGGLDPVPRARTDSRTIVTASVRTAAYDVAIQRPMGEPDAG